MPIESKGKRDPALAARIASGSTPQDEFVGWEFVVGRRALRVGEETRQPGDPIPEAASWPRLESWLRSGAVVQRPVGVSAARKTSQPRKAASVPHSPAEQAPVRPVLRPRKGVSQ